MVAAVFGRQVGVGMERGRGGVIKCHRSSYVPALHLRQDSRRVSSRHKSRCEDGTGAGGEGDTTVPPIHPFVTSPHRAEVASSPSADTTVVSVPRLDTQN